MTDTPTRQYFTGIHIDSAKVREDAEYWRNRGEASVVHYHAYNEACNDNCTTYEPGRDDDDTSDSTGEDQSDSPGL